MEQIIQLMSTRLDDIEDVLRKEKGYGTKKERT